MNTFESPGGDGKSGGGDTPNIGRKYAITLDMSATPGSGGGG